MLQVQNLSKSYGDIEALQSASFAVSPGEIVGLLGPNGAGKSTTIKIITGYLHPDEGTVSVDGLDVVDDARQTQAVVGYLPENAPLYPELSVQRYLQLVAKLRQIPDDERLGCLSEAIRAVGLEDRLTQRIGTLSKGFRQRVGLAQAILHRPKLLILDEPSIGLDPTQIVEMRRLIHRLSETSTVLFSTHILSEVEALCDRVVILMNGQVRLDCGLDELGSTPSATITLGQEPEGLRHTLATTPWIMSYEKLPSTDSHAAYRITGKESAATDLCPRLYSLATSHEWPLWELRRDTRTLEDVFNELATSQVEDPDATESGGAR